MTEARQRKRPQQQEKPEGTFMLSKEMIDLIEQVGVANITKNKHTQLEDKAKKKLGALIAQAADGNSVPTFEQSFNCGGETRVAEVSYVGGVKDVVDAEELVKRVSPEHLLAILIEYPPSQAAVKDIVGQNILDIVVKPKVTPPALSVKVKK